MADKKPKPKPDSRWKAGKSGNPAGRPKGRPDRRTAWRAELGDALPAILRKLTNAALAGDLQASALILARVAAPLRPSREPVAVEGINADASATETARGLIAAALRGELPTDAAAELVAALGAVARISQIDELAARVAELENRNV